MNEQQPQEFNSPSPLDSTVLTISGNLTTDPWPVEGGIAFNVGTAVELRRADGTKGKKSKYYRCTVWGQPAEAIAEAKKGDFVYVMGKESVFEWTDEAGEVHESDQISAYVCKIKDIVDRRKAARANNPTTSTNQSAPPPPPPATPNNPF